MLIALSVQILCVSLWYQNKNNMSNEEVKKELLEILNGTIERLTSLKNNNSGISKFVLSTMDGMYSVVNSGTGINGTCVAIKATDPVIFNNEESAESLLNTLAVTNGNGNIYFHVMTVEVYCHLLIAEMYALIDSIKKSN